MLAPVLVDLGPDVGARDVQVVIDACNDAISRGACLPAGGAGSEPARAVATARALDDGVRVVHIEVRLGADDTAAPIVRELEFARRDPLRERWRSVGLAIATLVGEYEQRVLEEAREEPEPVPEPELEPEPAPVVAEPPEAPEPAPVVAEPLDEPEPPEAQSEPLEHRSLFIGVGVLTGPGFGAGAWRAGGNLRAGWQAPSGWQLVTSLGYAWRASTVDFTAAWLSLDVGVGYRLAASDAFSAGALLLGGAERGRFEVLAAGVPRAEARWSPRLGLELDARFRASSGFGAWAALQGASDGRERRLFVAPERDPIRSAPVDLAITAGVGFWLE